MFKTTCTHWDYDLEQEVTEVPDEIGEIVEIPEGVKKIEGRAFWYYEKLKGINFPEGLEEIAYNAFANCSSLEKVDLPDSVKTIGNAAFYNCKALKEVRMSNSIESIGERAFAECTNVTDIITDGIESFEFMDSFDNLFNLTLTVSEETAKRLLPGITSEEDVVLRLGVASVVFK